MRASLRLVVCSLAFTLPTLSRSAKSGIVEIRSTPMAVTTFQPAKPHEVRTHWRLAFHRLRITPYTTQTFDRGRTVLGIRLTTDTSWGEFTNAPVVVVIDGKEVGRLDWLSWAVGVGWNVTEETSIQEANLVRAIARGKEVYLTIIMLGEQPPFDHISFKLSPEQLEDCQLIVAKYDELLTANK
jgi:hypothetical protein